jgi:hypothetical protein
MPSASDWAFAALALPHGHEWRTVVGEIGVRSAGNAPPAQKVGNLRLDSKDSLTCGVRWCNGLAFPEFIGEIEGMGKGEPSGMRTQRTLKKDSPLQTTPQHYAPLLCAHCPLPHHSLVQPRMPGPLGNDCALAWGNTNSCLECATRGTAKLARLAKVPRLFPLVALSFTWWQIPPATVSG